MKRVHLIISPLFHAMPAYPPITGLNQLELFLSRAQVSPAIETHLETILLYLFNLPSNAPIAAFTRLHDSGERQGYWLRADPVYLRPDQDRLVLFDAATALSLNQQEAWQLVQEINAFLHQDGLCFEAVAPNRWYLSLPNEPQFTTQPLRDVRGDDIRHHLPKGTERMRWQRYLNEIQMLLFQSNTNEKREQRGELPVNSVWFWGEGHLPNMLEKPRFSSIWSDDALALGLAKWQNIIGAATPANGVLWLNEFKNTLTNSTDNIETLVILNQNLQDEIEGQKWLNHLDDEWFKPLLGALKQGIINEIVLYPCHDKRTFSLNRWQLWQMWKWKQRWEKFVEL